MSITRRQFLKTSLVAAPVGAVMPAVFARTVAAAIDAQPAAAPGERVLVVVQLAGGNDGLNTVVPVSDDRYYDLRGLMGVRQEDVLALDAQTGLHPALGPLKELWDEGHVAIVEGVGYPNPNYSHFVSMDIWENADPTGKALDGWLGRYLAGIMPSQQAVVPSLAVDRAMPPSMRARGAQVAVVRDLASYAVQSDPQGGASAKARGAALAQLFQGASGASPLALALEQTLHTAQASAVALALANRGYVPAVEYPATGLGQGLSLVARAIAGGVGLRVGHVSMGGFDTHAGQLPDHEVLLTHVAEAIHAFYRDLQAHGLDNNVVLMTWTEFGRRVTANASGGTDHGSAGPQFVVGTPVKGGLYGERPSLADLDRNNLRYTTDFRSLYATLVEDWLGAPADLVLGGRFERLPLLDPAALATA
jgi:uncharacterized protein (DUF1501 family)